MLNLPFPENHVSFSSPSIDKPLKYPLMFSKVDALIINKIDVAPYFDFDMNKLREYVLKLNKNVKIFPISAKTGEGVEEWCQWLLNEVGEWKKQ